MPLRCKHVYRTLGSYERSEIEAVVGALARRTVLRKNRRVTRAKGETVSGTASRQLVGLIGFAFGATTRLR